MCKYESERIFKTRQKSVSENVPARSNICFRVREKTVDIKVITELAVYDKYWDNDALAYRRTTVVSAEEQKRIPQQIAAVIAEINATFDYGKANSDWLRQAIADVLRPIEAYERKHPSMLTRIKQYREQHDGGKGSKANIADFERKVTRYQAYRREIDGEADFTLFVERLTLEDMNDFRDYVANEYLLREEHTAFYAQFDKYPRKHKAISNTTLINTMNTFCTFLHWCKKQKLTEKDLYLQYGSRVPTYGDPFYLNLEERDRVYYAELEGLPASDKVYRDLFMFQCLIGCRASDLNQLTKANVVDGFIEYIPQKTKGHHANIVRVPLNQKALDILERYKELDEALLPRFTLINYNKRIKRILKAAGIDRVVRVLNPKTRMDEAHPLYEVASSHTARKTFIGNLYKQVKDPNLIASMSGHTEGSRAFARYRKIDDEMKQELVNLLD